MIRFFFRLVIGLGSLVGDANAQEQPFQWHNPANSDVQGIAGRGWASGFASPFNRFPGSAKEQLRNDVWQLSRNSAGLYISFTTTAPEIVVRYTVEGGMAMPHMPATGVRGVDLYARDEKDYWHWVNGKYNFGDTVEYKFSHIHAAIPLKEYRLYLPLYNAVNWLEIGAAEGSSFAFLPVPQSKPIVFYGTSILQGACASRPGLAYSNMLGRRLSQPVVNLGFSGNGLLEAPVIDLLQSIDASLYVLDCLPNLYDAQRFSREEVQQRIETAVMNLRKTRPDVPILLVEHPAGVAAASLDTALVNPYRRVNQLQQAVFDKLQRSGIKKLYLLPAEAFSFDASTTVDGTHPTDIGMQRYTDTYERMIRKITGRPAKKQ
ncbi:SGNH/GDSL hydrolase family protein [Flavihumibacter petaseus]|uniref:Hydrolase n=1 Tax=Flavihumibacter petaseus NBRC 106054 TaxID=1220578 RepID=A0A0E9N6L1_9BACT|nr:SGNH/GDSL hydrolase family protein [Flavihumibacter petaseus]GAO45428.1 hypothetical protein FPE01S_05_01230 [Flavihumibacter petaseus NBRC 106054]